MESLYPLSGTAPVTHILCLTSSFVRERLFQRHCRMHGIASIPLVETMVQFLTGLPGEVVSVSSMGACPSMFLRPCMRQFIF